MDLPSTFPCESEPYRWVYLRQHAKRGPHIHNFLENYTHGNRFTTTCIINLFLTMLTSYFNIKNYRQINDLSPNNWFYSVQEVRGLICATPVHGLWSTLDVPNNMIFTICNNFKGEVSDIYNEFGRNNWLANAMRKLKPITDLIYMPTATTCEIMTESIKEDQYKKWKNSIKYILKPSISLLTPPPYKMGLISHFSYDWFREIKFLSLQVDFTAIPNDPTKANPFVPGFTKYLKPQEKQILERTLTDNNIDPNMILISFPVYRLVRLHSRFYLDNIIEKIFEKKSNKTTIDFNSVRIFYYPQTISFPIYHGIVDKYRFNLNGINNFYHLKSITVLMNEEVTSYVKEFPSQNHVDYKLYKNLENCIDTIYHEINSLRAKFDKEDISMYISSTINQFSYDTEELFRKICIFLMRDAKSDFDPPIMPTHKFVVTTRNDTWIITNDEFSCAINNIVKFSQLMTDETITSVLLERTT
ncbi:hypothetical protein SNEBB_007162 [Seison nebaliae]|nr:hypothetical protein SNEBB_007162 [Seison nebaliae]